MENARENSQIYSVKHLGNKKMITVNNGGMPRPLTVPTDAPEIDPYDPKTGKGFMTPNSIVKSGLSANAKLMYMVLRSHICYGLGVVFPTEDQLEVCMSKSRKANRKAITELVKYGVIRKVKSLWNGRLKNYYYLNKDSEWRLPEPKEFAKHSKDELEESSSSYVVEPDFD